MARADIKAGAAYVELYVKNSRLQRGLQAAKQRLNAFGSEMQAVGRSAVTAAAGMLAPLGFAAKTFADFDDAMRMVDAVATKGSVTFEQLTETAKKLGRTTSFTATEVAALMGELGRAGFNTTQIDTMTSSVLSLARATGTEGALAAGIMAATMRQFGLEAGQAGRVADVLTAAANGSFNTVESLGEAMKFAGPVAADLGMSLEETAAILGTLGNVGIQGSMAGTTLKRLSVISAAEVGKLEKIFGRAFRDSSGEALPLIDMLSGIAEATNGLGQTERVEKMNAAFGLLGITGASAIGSATASTKELLETLQNSQGVADTTAAKMDAGLGGAFRIIMSAAEGVAIALGESIEKPLKNVVEAVTGFLGKVTELIGENQDMVVMFAKVGVAIGVIGGAFLAVGLSASLAATVLGGLSGILTFATAIFAGVVAVVSMFASVLFSVPGAIIALSAVILQRMGVFSNLGKAFSDTFGRISETASATFGGILDALKAGDIAAAGNIAMLGLQIAFMQGIEGLFAMFGPVGGEIMGALVGQIMNGDISGAWETVIVGLATVWESFANALGSIWTDITTFITDAWNNTIDGLSNKILEFAAQGGIINTVLKMVSGVDFAAEVAEQEKLNRDMKARGMNTGSDSGLDFKVDTPQIQSASDDQTVVDNIKDAADARRKAAQERIDQMKAEQAGMIAIQKATIEEKEAGESPPGGTSGGGTPGGGPAASSTAGSQLVTSSAAGLLAAGQGSTFNPTVTELIAIRRVLQEQRKENREAAKAARDAAREGGGIAVE